MATLGAMVNGQPFVFPMKDSYQTDAGTHQFGMNVTKTFFL